MNYASYEVAIISKYHVKLIGWPKDIAFTSPTKLTSIQQIREVVNALKCGDCRWMKLTAAEIKEHAKAMAVILAAEVEANGEGRKRKRRADAGGTHQTSGKGRGKGKGKGDETTRGNDQQDHQRQQKKRKATGNPKTSLAALPPMQFIHYNAANEGSSDEEDDEDESDSDEETDDESDSDAGQYE